MTEKTEKKAPAKKAETKAAKPAAKKEAAAKPATPKAEAAPKAKRETTGAKIRVIQTGSPIGRQAKQQGTLIGLGLNKRHRERVLEDTPEVRGMINAVKHLVRVEKAS